MDKSDVELIFSDSNSSQTIAEDESDFLKISSVDKPDSSVNDTSPYGFSALAAADDLVCIFVLFLFFNADDYPKSDEIF